MEQQWPSELRCWIYGVALVYCFLGVSIIADLFLAAIEMITSKKRRVLNPATGRYMTILLWNDTVANLSLLALGSSAPEILLSVVELFKNRCFSGQLGPATIVGSAAFNLLVIIAVCIVAIPSSEVRLIKETPVFYITGFFSVVAYVWLLVIVKVNSPEIVDLWEALVTLAMFPIVVLMSYSADRGFCSREAARPHIEWPISVDDHLAGIPETTEMLSSGQAPFAEKHCLRSLSDSDLSGNCPSCASLDIPSSSSGSKWKKVFSADDAQHLSIDARTRNGSVLSSRSMFSSRLSKMSAGSIQSVNYSDVAQSYSAYPADPSRGALHPKRWIASHRVGELTGSKRHVPQLESSGQSDLVVGSQISISSQSRRESLSSVRHSFRKSGRSSFLRNSVMSGSLSVPRTKSQPPPSPLRSPSHPSLASMSIGLVKEEDSQQPRPMHPACSRSTAGTEISADMHPVLPTSSSSQTAFPPCSTQAEGSQNHHNGQSHNHDHQPTTDAPQDPLPVGDNGEFIVDMDSNPVVCGAGVLTFCSDTLDVHAGADEREVVVPVLRRNGAHGTVSCRYRTECFTALPGYDYREVDGEIEFPAGVTRAEIRLSVLPKRPWERNDRFQVILEDAEGGVVFNPNDDGGWDRCVLTVTIINNSQSQQTGLRAAALRLGERMVDPDSMRLGMSMWKEQVKEAIFCNGSYEEQATASAADWMLHIMVCPWKILYALFVPPPVYLGGWICFALALCHIALLTAVVCDLAELFGCVAGVDDSVTAITFVALGTSLPDLFASRAAARADEYADASIVNVTGSNCVNVFLGIGLPWTVAAIYWKVKGATDKWKSRYPAQVSLHPNGAFVIKNDGLAFNVIVFGVAAVICLCLIRMRRVAFGGELGGPFGAKVFSGTLLVVLWAMYLFLSIWRSKRKDASLNEIIGVVLLSLAVILCLAIVFGVLLVMIPQNCGWLMNRNVASVVVSTPEPGASNVVVTAAPTGGPMGLSPPAPNGVPPVLNGAPLCVPLPPHGPPPDDDDPWGLEDGISAPPDAARLLKALHCCKVQQAWLQQEASRTLDAITAIEQVIRGETVRSVISAERTPMTSTSDEDEVTAQKVTSGSRSAATERRSPSPNFLSVHKDSERRTHPVCWDSQGSRDRCENAQVASIENCDDQVATIGQCWDASPDEKMSRPMKDIFAGTQTPRGVSTVSTSDQTSSTRSCRPSASAISPTASHDLIGMVHPESLSTVPGSLPSPPTLPEVRRPLPPMCQSYSSGQQADGPQPIPIGSQEPAMRHLGTGKQGWCSDNM